MSQNDFNLANQGFAAMRSDMNSALQALASNSSGVIAPATTYPYQWWYDTTENILKLRNATNADWMDFATFDQSTGTVSIIGIFPSFSGNAKKLVRVNAGETATEFAPANPVALDGFASTVTAGGTSTLTAASSATQQFTGTANQTVALPVASTLIQNWSFDIVNASTGVITVNSSGGNLVGSIPAGMTAKVRCILASGTTAASWALDVQRIASQGLITTSTASGTVKTVTGIPIWANEVVIHLNGIGLTAVENINLRIGTASGGISSTGYFSISPVFNSSAFVTGSSTTSFVLAHSGTGRNAAGAAVLRRGAGNRWSVDANYYLGSGICAIANGTGLLPGPLDRIELSCASGFNAGDFSVEWRA
jgi:hypothetical protein